RQPNETVRRDASLFMGTNIEQKSEHCNPGSTGCDRSPPAGRGQMPMRRRPRMPPWFETQSERTLRLPLPMRIESEALRLGLLPRPQPHVNVLLVREREHLLEAFLTADARLLHAAERHAEEVFPHLVDPHEAGFDLGGGAVRG